MSSATVAFSPRFRRAAAAERERLSARLDGAKTKARERKGELAAAEADVEELEARLDALGSLLDGPAAEPAAPSGALRGRAIREIAVEVLVGRLPDAGPIHYRAWLAAVEAEAGPVAGKRPEAVFPQSGDPPPLGPRDDEARLLSARPRRHRAPRGPGRPPPHLARRRHCGRGPRGAGSSRRHIWVSAAVARARSS